MAIFEQKYHIPVANVDASTYITNLGILSMLEDIAGKHSDIAGYGITDIPQTHLFWVLLAWKVEVIRRVKYKDEVTLRTWAKNTNKFYTYRDFEMLDQNGNVVCKATSKWALINMENKSLAKISDEIISLYQPEKDRNVFENPDIEKLTIPDTYSSEYLYKTQRRDIDINEHMHNSNYLSLAYEALPQEVYDSGEYNHIEIMYKKGIKFGDTSKCLYSCINKEHFVTIKSEDEKDLHAIIKLY